MSRRRRAAYVPLDEEQARRLRIGLDRVRNKLIARTSINDDRAQQLYAVLQEWDEPLSMAEIHNIFVLLGWPISGLRGDLSPLKRLVWEGKVGQVGTRGHYKYYADPDLSPELTEHAPLKDID